MSNATPVTLYVNVIGAVCALGLGAYFVRSSFEDNSAPRCSSTYPSATQISFENGIGEPMSPVELQARAGSDERGVLENARIVKVTGAPSPSVLEVQVSGSADPGVRSSWSLASLRSATSACLAYSVWLPDDFRYGNYGLLPGLYAGRKPEPGERPAADSGFATRLRWNADGAGDFLLQAAAGRAFSGTPFKIAAGRWVRIEQEVTLNTPGKSDGQLRAWVDGKLAFEASDIAYRGDHTVTLGGVAADIGYGDQRSGGKQTALRLTPFELSWR